MRLPHVVFALALIAGLHRAAAQPGAPPAHGAQANAVAPPDERLGEVDFPTSSATPAAHAAFVTGVLYLHNFHYPQAARAFARAHALDPGDVMATWGEVMTYTHPVWNEQDTAAARAALRTLGPTREARLAMARTPRERAWLDAAETLYAPDGGTKPRRDTAYAEAMARLHAADPRDAEAPPSTRSRCSVSTRAGARPAPTRAPTRLPTPSSAPTRATPARRTT